MEVKWSADRLTQKKEKGVMAEIAKVSPVKRGTPKSPPPAWVAFRPGDYKQWLNHLGRKKKSKRRKSFYWDTQAKKRFLKKRTP